ncbi:MAG: hypothetical protein Kow0079_05050 [Vicingaceae bacterium]
MLFNILLDLGLTNYNNRNIAQNNHLVSQYFSGIFLLKFLLGVVYFLITVLAFTLLGFEIERLNILIFLCINQFLISFIQFLRSNLSGLQFYTLDSLLTVLDKTLMIIICGIFLWHTELKKSFNVFQFTYLQTIAYSITFFIVLFIVFKKIKNLKFYLSSKRVKIILKQTLPFALLVLTMTFYYRLDSVMLDLLHQDSTFEVAVYAQSFRLLDAGNMIGVLFAGLLLPMFSYMLKKKESVEELTKFSATLIFIISFAVFMFTWFDAPIIIDMLYNKNQAQSAQVLIPLMSAFVFINLSYIFGTLLTANGSLRALNTIALGGLVINFSLNYIFIPNYGALGAAYTSLLTQTLIIIAQIIYCYKQFNFSLKIKETGRFLLYIILLVAGGYFFKKFNNKIIFDVLFFGIYSILMAFLLQIVSLPKLKQLLHKKLIE